MCLYKLDTKNTHILLKRQGNAHTATLLPYYVKIAATLFILAVVAFLIKMSDYARCGHRTNATRQETKTAVTNHLNLMLPYQTAALPIIAFPLMLCIGIILIPVMSNYANHDLAQKAAKQTKRWFWGHLISGLAFGVGLLALFSLSLFLFEQQIFLWPNLALPSAALGTALLAFGMGADGIGPLAVSKAGHPAQLFFDGSRHWVMGSFIAGSILFGLGQILMVIGVNQQALLNTSTSIIILLAAIVFSVSAAIPSGWGLYVLGLSACIIYLPIGFAFWQVV